VAFELLDRPGDFIDGRFALASAAEGELIVRSPADLGDRVAVHPYALAQVDRAVEAARRAQPGWRKLGLEARATLLRAYAAKVRAAREALAELIAREVGKPLWEARGEADAVAAKVELTIGEGLAAVRDVRVAGVGEVRYLPHGVMAVVGPFNLPAHLPNGQFVPALLLGNTVVHKPSELAPSVASLLARCLHEAELPPGVFNLVQGPASVGARLIEHADVDGVLFTGSLAVGQRILHSLADRPGRLVALELGGKNASIALDDCDLEASARRIVFSAFATAGQRCSCSSRLIVTEAVAEPLLDRVCELATALGVGHPWEPDVFMGPVISSAAHDRVIAAQAAARLAGFEALVAGGPCDVGHPGHYLRPAVHRAPTAVLDVPGYTDVELFGPDLAVYVVPDREAAFALANRSRFGLSAAVYTRSSDSFERACAELRVGVLHWNQPTAGASSRLPFGGIKDSGNHRPAGILATTSCAYPMGILDAPTSADLPSWPGLGQAAGPATPP
jgi:succinylglutamic semialdehyde dehydrogenase